MKQTDHLTLFLVLYTTLIFFSCKSQEVFFPFIQREVKWQMVFIQAAACQSLALHCDTKMFLIYASPSTIEEIRQAAKNETVSSAFQNGYLNPFPNKLIDELLNLFSWEKDPSGNQIKRFMPPKLHYNILLKYYEIIAPLVGVIIHPAYNFSEEFKKYFPYTYATVMGHADYIENNAFAPLDYVLQQAYINR